jgi:hypothetical protein
MQKLIQSVTEGPIDLTTVLKKRRSSFFDLAPARESKKEARRTEQMIEKLEQEKKDWISVVQTTVKSLR